MPNNTSQVQVVKQGGHKSFVPLPSKPSNLGPMPTLPAARGVRV